MKIKKMLMLAVVLLCFVFMACTNSDPVLSQAQLRELTTKEVEANYETTFKAVMTVLQDQDYIIENTDFKSGLIKAGKDLKKDPGFLAGIGPSQKISSIIDVAATVSPVTSNVTKIRLNIRENFFEVGLFSSPFRQVRNIQEKKIYDELFNQIRVEIERTK